MFARVSVALLALPLLAAASVIARGGEPAPTVNQCNTGNLGCCNTVGTQQQLLANKAVIANNAVAVALGLLNDATANIGVGCSPLSIVGIAGNSCTQQPVCCTNNQFNGLVDVGCSPINLNL